MAIKTPITVAHGDGIGPEIMAATLDILNVAEAQLAVESIEIGERVYKQGFSAGIKPDAWASLRRTKVFLKAPITTPQGGGFKSLNVTIRKTLGLFANVRPCVSYHPFVATRHPKMDMVIVRENEEDLYAGIEHRQTDEVFQCLKLITRPGCEKIARYAFDYARAHGRKHVTCMTKDNIMKMTDGLFHQVFDETARDYPEIKSDHYIIDIGTALVADDPQRFDVIVLPNLYGDILSDVSAQITGSVGLAGSANIGEHIAMFEAIHGSAPDIAGKGVANPSGLLLGAVQMLIHLGKHDVAERVHNAWLRTLEEGIHTPDVHSDGRSERRVGTEEFAHEVIKRLGKQPETLAPVRYRAATTEAPVVGRYVRRPAAKKAMVGVDVFVHWRDGMPELVDRSLASTQSRAAEVLAGKLAPLATASLELKMITNRGVKVWPGGFPETFCTDHWRCRFMTKTEGATITHQDLITLLGSLERDGVDFIKTENLCTFDGEPGYALGQGQ